jgi:hypothetical protein
LSTPAIAAGRTSPCPSDRPWRPADAVRTVTPGRALEPGRGDVVEPDGEVFADCGNVRDRFEHLPGQVARAAIGQVEIELTFRIRASNCTAPPMTACQRLVDRPPGCVDAERADREPASARLTPGSITFSSCVERDLSSRSTRG